MYVTFSVCFVSILLLAGMVELYMRSVGPCKRFMKHFVREGVEVVGFALFFFSNRRTCILFMREKMKKEQKEERRTGKIVSIRRRA